MKRIIKMDVVEITAVFIIRKDYFDEEGLNVANIKDKIQQGIEIPLEEIDVKLKK